MQVKSTGKAKWTLLLVIGPAKPARPWPNGHPCAERLPVGAAIRAKSLLSALWLIFRRSKPPALLFALLRSSDIQEKEQTLKQLLKTSPVGSEEVADLRQQYVLR